MESTTQTQTTAQEPKPVPGGAARIIRKVRKATKRKFTADQKIKIVLEGFRKEIPATELCRREKVSTAVSYVWLKEFMEGGKNRLRGNTLRSATSDEVASLKQRNKDLKELVGEQVLELSLLKKRLLW
jgi:transposase-like protein